MKNFSRPLKRLGYYSTCIQYSNPGLPLTISHSHPFYNVSPPRRYLRVSHGTTLHDVTGCCSGSVWHLFCFLILPHNDGGGGGCHTFINVFSLIIILHFSFSTANCTQGSSSPLCCTCVCVCPGSGKHADVMSTSSGWAGLHCLFCPLVVMQQIILFVC